MWQRLGISKWLGKDEDETSSESDSRPSGQPRSGLGRRFSKKVGVGLPRAATFRRVNSERRDKLEPIGTNTQERRAISHDRRRTHSAQRPGSPIPQFPGRQSAPETRTNYSTSTRNGKEGLDSDGGQPGLQDLVDPDGPDLPLHHERSNLTLDSVTRDREREERLRDDLDRRWILNLSMHFRDKSEREKFFITYAETPTRWRRVTVSCDYRDAAPDSLESDLKKLQFQRDKSARIYDSILESLPEIQFYDTVTNLKLQTNDGRLHVHVTEDMNEIIPYPPHSAVQHLDACLISESQLEFESHLSGFVYKVRYNGRTCIKKEIPGPDTVDEFLYEINALDELKSSGHVIQLEGVILDESRECIKGLLISYAEQGALVDMIYDSRGDLEWPRRQKWAKQVVHGLADIHEAGYVQGDFTLSNIVVDSNDDAQIIDINRRGCPVGWEPPEISRKIDSNQRISMYIGVKSDIFQLGMTLWAIAVEEDEPERHQRPLGFGPASQVPEWYQRLVFDCLQEKPQRRPSAKELLKHFPVNEDQPNTDLDQPLNLEDSTPQQCSDPASKFDSDSVSKLGRSFRTRSRERTSSYNGTVYIEESNTSTYTLGNGASCSTGSRGRSPHRHTSSRKDLTLEATQVDDPFPQILDISPYDQKKFDVLELQGVPYLVPRGSFEPDDLEALKNLVRPEVRRRCSDEIENPAFGQKESFERSRATDASKEEALAVDKELPPQHLSVGSEPLDEKLSNDGDGGVLLVSNQTKNVQDSQESLIHVEAGVLQGHAPTSMTESNPDFNSQAADVPLVPQVTPISDIKDDTAAPSKSLSDTPRSDMDVANTPNTDAPKDSVAKAEVTAINPKPDIILPTALETSQDKIVTFPESSKLDGIISESREHSKKRVPTPPRFGSDSPDDAGYSNGGAVRPPGGVMLNDWHRPLPLETSRAPIDKPDQSEVPSLVYTGSA